MKKIISLLLITLFCFNGYADELFCSSSNSEENPTLQTCDIYQGDQNSVGTCNTQSDPTTNSKDIFAKCDGVDPKKMGFDKKTAQEIKDIKKSLHKQCRQKAKEYKKAVLADLMKNGKIGQALKVLFKRKKTTEKDTRSKPVKMPVSVTPEQLAAMSEAELNQYVMDELDKMSPGLKQQAENLKNNDPSYKYGFHENESTPYNIIVKPDQAKACSLDLDDLPTPEKFTPKTCEFCEIKNMHKSFVNDCSYMVSKEFPESEVDKLIGSTNENRKEYCQPDMSKKDNRTDMAEIDAMAKNLCDIANEGMVPNFEIKTARNLYPDSTPDLAAKRGQFIQKYLRQNLQKNCFGENPEDQPEWLKTESAFNDQVKLTHPYYEGGKTGDYGPDPLAKTPEGQAKEVKNYEATLAHEETEINTKITSLKEEIQILEGSGEGSIKNVQNLITTNTSTYNKQKDKLEKTTDVKQMQQIYEGNGADSIPYLSQQVHMLSDELPVKQQHLADLKVELASLEKQLLTYKKDSKTKNYPQVAKLGLYYDDLNKGKLTPSKTEQWNKDLFENFKMVKISGNATPVTVAKTPDNAVSPQLDIMINMMVDTQQYACTVDPMSTKKTNLKGVLKGAGQFVVGALLVAPTLVVGAGVVVAGVGNTFLSIFCNGCGRPGKQLPEWRMVGNLFAIGTKGQRKAFWRHAKKSAKNIITLGGALSIDKKSEVRKYNDFDKYAKEYYGKNSTYDDKTDRPKHLVIKETKDELGNLTFVESKDANGKLYETLEYKKDSIIRTRYNKDGVAVETVTLPKN